MANEDDDKKGFKGVGDLFKKPVAETPKEHVDEPVLPRRQPESPPKASSADSANSSNTSSTASNIPNESSGCFYVILVSVVILGLIIFIGSSRKDPASTNDVGEESAFEASSPALPEPKSAYIVTELANVRSAGNPQAEVVAQLPQWSSVSVIDGDDKWSRISFTTDAGVAEGFISNQLFAFGTQQDARNAYCDVSGSIRPQSGEVLSQQSTGSHSITINGGDRDALIKLRSNGSTALSFYVRANETGKVANVADGQYQVMFATGTDFSRKCLEFMTDMNVIADPNTLAMQTTTEDTYEGVTTYFATAEYTLTRQANGNFRPETLDPNAFKE